MSLPFRVYSQTRSGTHWLMALLHKHFDFGCDLSQHVQLPNHVFESLTGPQDNVPWGKLHGGHGALPPGYPTDIILYVIRHPITRAYSLWRFGLRQETFEEFATAKLFETWKQHAQSYIGAPWVRYEELHDPSRILEDIRRRWNLIPLPIGWSPITQPVGWSPNCDKLSYASPKIVAVAKSVLGGHIFDYEVGRIPEKG